MSEKRHSRIMDGLRTAGRTALEIVVGAGAGWEISDALYEGTRVSGELAITMGGYYDRMDNNAVCAVIGGVALPILTRVVQAVYRHYKNRAASRNSS